MAVPRLRRAIERQQSFVAIEVIHALRPVSQLEVLTQRRDEILGVARGAAAGRLRHQHAVAGGAVVRAALTRATLRVS